MKKLSLRDIEVKGKRVLVRADFNVPLDQTGAILDDSRIRATLPTINYLLEQKAKVILCSHLGRPKGREEGLSLAPVARHLSQLLGREVKKAKDCVGPEVEREVASLGEGDVLLLENLRFHPEEENNDPDFSLKLALLGEVYVNDAFSTAHRVHASMVGVPRYIPAVMGFLMEKEFGVLDRAVNNPDRPFTLLIGGARITDKIGILEHLLERIDSLLIAGGMGSAFIKSLTRIEEGKANFAQRLIEEAKEKGVHLLFPEDVVIAERYDPRSKTRTVPLSNVPSAWLVMDIGPKTMKVFEAKLRKSKTVIWVGPVGVTEFPKFREGNNFIAKVMSELDAITIVAGGSTAEAVIELGLAEKMTLVSFGGGATLQFLEGKSLPGVMALWEK